MRISLIELERSLEELMDIRDEILTEHPGFRDPLEREKALELVEVALADYVKRDLKRVDGIHGYCRYTAATAEAARAEAAVLLDKAKRLDAQEERLKNLCMSVMVEMGKTKLEGTAGRVITRQKSGGIQALQVQEDIIPDTYCDFSVKVPGDVWAQVLVLLPRVWRDRMADRYKREPSQSRIREALAQDCEGCAGAGQFSIDQAMGTVATCPECGGGGKAGVPGAKLLERGETIRIK